MLMDKCAWCESPKIQAEQCPECGAIYAKAEAIKYHGKYIKPATESLRSGRNPAPGQKVPQQENSEKHDSNSFVVEGSDDSWRNVDLKIEKLYYLMALPSALLIAIIINNSGAGSSLFRIVFGMPIHELGHALAGWLSGYNSVPTLWKTLTPTSKGFILPLMVFTGFAYLTYYCYSQNNRWGMGGCLFMLVFQLIACFGLSHDSAHTFIVFSGDGLGMLLATALMVCFYFGKNTQLYKGALRWGFLTIGAAAFIDMYSTWWLARSDIGSVPYGYTGGIASDSKKLIDIYGWRWQQLINRYFWLGNLCWLILIAFYVKGLVTVKRKIDEANDF